MSKRRRQRERGKRKALLAGSRNGQIRFDRLLTQAEVERLQLYHKIQWDRWEEEDRSEEIRSKIRWRKAWIKALR